MPVIRRLGAELSWEHGRVLIARPPDPNLEQPAAGVAAIGRSADTLRCLEPLRSPGPTLTTVDLNADPEDVDQVVVLMATHGWVDLGAIAST